MIFHDGGGWETGILINYSTGADVSSRGTGREVSVFKRPVIRVKGFPCERSAMRRSRCMNIHIIYIYKSSRVYNIQKLDSLIVEYYYDNFYITVTVSHTYYSHANDFPGHVQVNRLDIPSHATTTTLFCLYANVACVCRGLNEKKWNVNVYCRFGENEERQMSWTR